MKKGDKIFVYGTLRPGRSAAIPPERAKRLGVGRISGRLYDLGSYPGVILSENNEDKVVGDVLEILDDRLPQYLDYYEGYPDLYDRCQVTTEDDQTVWVYTYQGHVSHAQRIESGVWGQ